MYILDIETQPDRKLKEVFYKNIKPNARLKDPAKIEEDLEKKKEKARKEMSVSVDYSEIICIGVKQIGRDPMIFKTMREFTDWLNKPADIDKERTAVYNPEYASMIASGEAGITNADQVIITFNGQKFDIPALMRCAIKEGIDDFPFGRFSGAAERYPRGHVDMLQAMKTEYKDFVSLDTYLQIYLGIEKTPVDFEVATTDEIITHCVEDLVNTEKLFDKLANKIFFV